MQSLLLSAYSFAFKTCTSAGTYAALSSKERRCVQQAVSNYVEARAFVAQHMAANNHAAGKDV
jgi:hypothetical protein